MSSTFTHRRMHPRDRIPKTVQGALVTQGSQSNPQQVRPPRQRNSTIARTQRKLEQQMNSLNRRIHLDPNYLAHRMSQ